MRHKADYASDGPMRCGLPFKEAVSQDYSYLWREVNCDDCIDAGFREYVSMAKRIVLVVHQWWRLGPMLAEIEKIRKAGRKP